MQLPKRPYSTVTQNIKKYFPREIQKFPLEKVSKVFTTISGSHGVSSASLTMVSGVIATNVRLWCIVARYT